MKLGTFRHAGQLLPGRIEGEEIVNLVDAGLPEDLKSILDLGHETMSAVARANGSKLPLSEVTLEAPIQRPGKFFGIGLNYDDHIKETGLEKPTFPVFFNKQSTCVSGPFGKIHRPRVSNHLDYEGELGVVIGRRCRHVPRDRAGDVIAGFCVVNVVSVRDWQMKSKTFVVGKGFDTHGPHGPWITTSDEAGDPHNLDLKTWVNGELRQNSNTSNLTYDCYELIETITKVCTMEPGDIISTGTPSGVALGFDPPKWLVPGDRVKIEIQNLGFIENTVIDEPLDTDRV